MSVDAPAHARGNCIERDTGALPANYLYIDRSHATLAHTNLGGLGPDTGDEGIAVLGLASMRLSARKL